jgi:hypothetical protein
MLFKGLGTEYKDHQDTANPSRIRVGLPRHIAGPELFISSMEGAAVEQQIVGVNLVEKLIDENIGRLLRRQLAGDPLLLGRTFPSFIRRVV